MSNKPNLFILGAPKAGTTALANNLSQHKDIFISEQKEPRFFDAHTFYDYEEDYPIKTLNEYLKLFDSDIAKTSKYRLDASVFNMYSEKSINDILKLSPEAKFIVLIREPVSATLSMHRQRLGYIDVKMREVSDDFMECWKKLEDRKRNNGYPKNCRNKFLFRYDLLYSYEKYLPFLIHRIEKNNLFVGFYDDFIKTPELFYGSIFNFLNIDNMQIDNKKLNNSSIIKKSKFLEFIDFLSRKSFLIRDKFGLTGGKINLIKKFIFNLYTSDNIQKQQVDNRVYDFFENTNKYINMLKNQNRIK